MYRYRAGVIEIGLDTVQSAKQLIKDSKVVTALLQYTKQQ